jgi:putative ABC transport system permease protein
MMSMNIPLIYSVRNLFTRRLTMLLTVLGIALVVFVFSAVLMLASGLRKTLVATGDEHNVLLLRKGSDTELVSGVQRDLVNLLRTLPQIAVGQDGKPVVSAELVTIINLMKTGTNAMGNVTVRGVSPPAFQLRPVIQMTDGRVFTAGAREIIVGSSINKRFAGARTGQLLKFGGDTWTIVGVFEANGTGFESEVWGDSDELLQAFNRPAVPSSVTVKLKDASDYNAFRNAVDGDQRLQQLTVERERDYYERQSELMATFIRILGLVVTIIFSAGAIIGAMITMYAAVANRTTEIGTLRAIGFQRRSVLITFLIESIIISLVGGGLGLLAASFLQIFTISTTNFSTFVELAFSFALSPDIALKAMIFALVMGVIGGFLPAVRAARLDILTALRAS